MTHSSIHTRNRLPGLVNPIFNPISSISVDFDSIPTSAVGSNVSSISFSHTVLSGTNGFLVVPVFNGTDTDIVTYGMNTLTSYGFTGTYPNTRCELWGLVNPPIGTDTVTVTFPSNFYAEVGAVAFKNVNQTFPVSGLTTDALNTDAVSLTIPSSATSMVLGCISYWNPDGDILLDSGLYSLWSISSDGAWKASSFTKGGSSSVSLSVSNMSISNYHSFIGISIDAI